MPSRCLKNCSKWIKRSRIRHRNLRSGVVRVNGFDEGVEGVTNHADSVPLSALRIDIRDSSRNLTIYSLPDGITPFCLPEGHCNVWRTQKDCLLPLTNSCSDQNDVILLPANSRNDQNDVILPPADSRNDRNNVILPPADSRNDRNNVILLPAYPCNGQNNVILVSSNPCRGLGFDNLLEIMKNSKRGITHGRRHQTTSR